MDQKSFSVLLNFSQSSPFEGGAISGAVALSAAYAVNELVQPASVIVNHVNEAATSGGKVKPATRTAAFIALVKGRPVYPALSGKTMEFDGAGKCLAGC